MKRSTDPRSPCEQQSTRFSSRNVLGLRVDCDVMNPFPYQRPILPEQVIDRDLEVQKLLSWCDSAMLGRLDAPRRYGKTSLVRKVFHEAGKHGTVGVLCDLKGGLTLSDVITRLGRSYAQLRGSLEKLL